MAPGEITVRDVCYTSINCNIPEQRERSVYGTVVVSG